MSLSMYDASIGFLIRELGILSSLLSKAEAHAEAKKIDPEVFITARLYPDMLPLRSQIQIASDGAKGCGARLAGVEIPSFPDDEKTFPDLQARIAKTIDFLKGIDAAKLEGCETRSITLKMRAGDVEFTGKDFLLNFGLPNFQFHVVTTYAILRHNGVEIGKRDYLSLN